MPVRFVLTTLLTVVFLVSIANESRGQSVEEWRATEEGEAPREVIRDQNYEGVTPGSGNTLPRVEELKGKPGTWVTWPGFLMPEGGGSRFFLQTTVAVDYKITNKKKTLVIRLNNAAIHLSNNRNPLVTTHFNTPVSRAYLKKRGKHVDLILELKVDATPQITQMADQDGYHYMFIDFAPGQYPMVSDRLTVGNQGDFDAL